MTLEGKYEVATADSAADALDHLAKHKTDLVLMDINMPRMNGIEALKKIRESHPELMVVMLTAYPTEEHIQQAWESGASGFLAKPFEVHELRDFVDSTLSGKG